MVAALRSPCLLGIAIALASVDARAQPVEDIGLIYTAPPSCPTADEFFARVAERAPVRRVGAARPRTFEIAIEERAGAVHGSLAIRAGTELTTREVDGSTCEETVAALAIVAALAVSAEAPPAIATRPSPPRRPPSPWIAVGAGLARFHGVTPAWVFGVPAFAELGRSGGMRIRAGIARTAEQAQVMAAGTTEFRWTTARIDVTPISFGRGRFAIAPALGVEAGVLEGRGTTIAMPARDSRLWLAPDVALRLRFFIGRFALELEGELAAPLIRDRFFIAPDTTVHQVPHLTAGVGVTLAVSLP